MTMRFILFLLMTFTAAFSEGQTSKTKQPVLGTEVMYGKTTKQNGKWILLSGPSGKHFKAYAAGPANSRIGILFVHDFFGLSSAPEIFVEYLGALGYRVVAVDLYNGKVVGNDEAAAELMKGKDSAITVQILRADVFVWWESFSNRSED